MRLPSSLRLRAWLLVALLAFSAQFGVTVSRVAPPRQQSAIVQIAEADGSHAEAQATTASVRVRQTALRQHSREVLWRATTPLPAKLFQLPPPNSFFS